MDWATWTLHAEDFDERLAVQVFMIAVVVMGVLQASKDLLPVRRYFQQYWLRQWITVRSRRYRRVSLLGDPTVRQRRRRRETGGAIAQAVTAVTENRWARWTAFLLLFGPLWRMDRAASEAWDSLIALAVGGRKGGLFRLPSEQLVGQMNAAAQYAVEYPNRYNSLLRILSQGVQPNNKTDAEDIANLQKYAQDNPDQKKPDSGISDGKAPTIPAPPQEYMIARSRISNRIQRNLDAIHVALAGDWKFFMQVLAIILAFALAYNLWDDRPGVSLLVAFASGYLASIIRDVLAIVPGQRGI
jgi:hypothetical protein